MSAQSAAIQALAHTVEMLARALTEAQEDAAQLAATQAELRKRTRDLTRTANALRRALDCLSRLRQSTAISGDAAAALNLALSLEDDAE